jgi:hypothetical protein
MERVLKKNRKTTTKDFSLRDRVLKRIFYPIPGDVILSVLLPKLGRVDYCVLMMAITFKEERMLMDRPYFATECALEGYFDLIRWAYNYSEYLTVTDETSFNAVKSGNVQLVRWLYGHACSFHKNILAFVNNFDVMVYLINQGYTIHSFYIARKIGANCDSKTLEFLMYSAAAREYVNVIIDAAKQVGNSEFMDWCKENKFPRYRYN